MSINKIKVFKCGLCNNFSGARRDLRKHLGESHIKNNFANATIKKSSQRHSLKESNRQNWWITEEIKSD